MIIESNKVIVNKDINTVFAFLKDSNNIQHLMPLDKISNWKSDESSCSFKVQGGIIISFSQLGFEEPKKIFLVSEKKSPFPFKLTIFFKQKQEKTEGYLLFDGEVNYFLKMMIEVPLTHLFNSMTEKLQTYYS
jgi:hypothetical protein